MSDRSESTPVYSIAVAAQLSGLPQATLRLYEKKGLLTPARTEGGTRRYSDDEVTRLRQVADLQKDGVNLTGISMVLELQDQNEALRKQVADTAGSAPTRSQEDAPES